MSCRSSTNCTVTKVTSNVEISCENTAECSVNIALLASHTLVNGGGAAKLVVYGAGSVNCSCVLILWGGGKTTSNGPINRQARACVLNRTVSQHCANAAECAIFSDNERRDDVFCGDAGSCTVNWLGPNSTVSCQYEDTIHYFVIPSFPHSFFA